MPHQVQSRAGVTISDVYDVKGSQAPVERIDIDEVKGVHELGGTIQSERFSTTIRRSATAALGQSTTFNTVLADLPNGVTRILGVQVLVNNGGRTQNLSVMVRDRIDEREFPLFVWDQTHDIEKLIRIADGSGGVVNTNILIPVAPSPRELSMLTGTDQPQRVSDIAFRGTTQAFGAGTVTYILLAHIAFSAIGGISSRGLPVPSW